MKLTDKMDLEINSIQGVGRALHQSGISDAFAWPAKEGYAGTGRNNSDI